MNGITRRFVAAGIAIWERERRIEAGLREWSDWCVSFVETRADAMLFVGGAMVLVTGLTRLAEAQGGGPTGSYSQAQFDDTLIRSSVGMLFKLIEGGFGALIMVVSGIGAIVAAAMGAYRAAVGMIVVAVGSFILRSLVSLFFGTDFQDYEA